jgi:hypothetical protein
LVLSGVQSPLNNPSIGLTLPVFVKAEFDAFLDFGIFAHEFLGLRRDRVHQWVLSFSELQNSRVLKVKSSASFSASLALSLVDRQPTLSQ